MKATIPLSYYYYLTSSEQSRQYYNDLLQVLEIKARASVHSNPKYDFVPSDINDSQMRVLIHLAYAQFAEGRGASMDQLYSDLRNTYSALSQETFKAEMANLAQRQLLKTENSLATLIFTTNEHALLVMSRLYSSHKSSHTQAAVVSSSNSNSNSNSNAPVHHPTEPPFTSSSSSSQLPSLQQGTSPATFSTRPPSTDSANTTDTIVSLSSNGATARQKNKNPPVTSIIPPRARASKGNKKVKTAPAPVPNAMPNQAPIQSVPSLDTNFILQELARFKEMAQVNQQCLNDMAQQNQNTLNAIAQENQRRFDAMFQENQKRLDAMDKEIKSMGQQITMFSAPYQASIQAPMQVPAQTQLKVSHDIPASVPETPRSSNLNGILPLSPPLASLSGGLPPVLSLNDSTDGFLNFPSSPSSSPPLTPTRKF